MTINTIDAVIFVLYFIAMLGIGFFFYNKNENADDYYLGGRQMNSWHTGLSVVATDVGGGFSIGLGGLGFTIGLSGSWMLCTGLLGAWLSGVFLIPRIRRLPQLEKLYTFPQVFSIFFNKKVALLAGIITAIGYLGFTSSQLLAGAKLASATFPTLDIKMALLIMGVIAVVYTTSGGLKAVIYTDTVQWIILMAGLVFIGIPLSFNELGGFEAVRQTLSAEYLRVDNIDFVTIINWAVTIIPIWFIGMTLYQRIFACKSEKEAKKAWFIAGLFEWPIMAFMGVVLGMFAKVAFEQDVFAHLGYGAGSEMDPEMGLPLLLRNVLPVGFMGLMMSAYFSAIMSTADSCLMAASGNVVTDIIESFKKISYDKHLKFSQIATLGLGVIAVVIALGVTEVLGLMLYSYAFMVSGLFVPLIGALFWRKASTEGAFWAMLSGGTTTVTLEVLKKFEIISLPLGLDANIYGIILSLIVFVSLSLILPGNNRLEEKYSKTDIIEDGN